MLHRTSQEPAGFAGEDGRPRIPGNALQPRRLWETDKIFRCPLMGMCLAFPDQKRLLKKAGYRVKSLGAYEIHEILIDACKDENRLSRKIESLLNRQYERETAPLIHLAETEFMECWRRALKNGNCEAALWAAATRPALSTKSRVKVFGDVHMAMHETAWKSAEFQKALAKANQEIRDLRDRADERTREMKALLRENRILSEELGEERSARAARERDRDRLQAELATAKDFSRTAALERENRELAERCEGLLEEREESKRKLDLAEETGRRLTERIRLREEAREDLVEQAREMIGDFLKMEKCDASCPSFALCKKRVLIVGGLTKMESLYRELVEGGGGVFEYHDGYLKSGSRDLESRLKRADLVLCPVSCNSHGACSLVKSLGKKHGKPVHMLKSVSLCAVSQAISKAGA